MTLSNGLTAVIYLHEIDIENKEYVGCILMDQSKAFDSIHHYYYYYEPNSKHIESSL